MSLLSMGIDVAKQNSIPKSHVWKGCAVGLKTGYRVLYLLRAGRTQAGWQVAVRRMSAEDFQGTVLSVREGSSRRSLWANSQQPAVQYKTPLAMFATFNNVHHDAPEHKLRRAALTQTVQTDSIGTKIPRAQVTATQSQTGRKRCVWSISYIGSKYN